MLQKRSHSTAWNDLLSLESNTVRLRAHLDLQTRRGMIYMKLHPFYKFLRCDSRGLSQRCANSSCRPFSSYSFLHAGNSQTTYAQEQDLLEADEEELCDEAVEWSMVFREHLDSCRLVLGSGDSQARHGGLIGAFR